LRLVFCPFLHFIEATHVGKLREKAIQSLWMFQPVRKFSFLQNKSCGPCLCLFSKLSNIICYIICCEDGHSPCIVLCLVPLVLLYNASCRGLGRYALRPDRSRLYIHIWSIRQQCLESTVSTSYIVEHIAIVECSQRTHLVPQCNSVMVHTFILMPVCHTVRYFNLNFGLIRMSSYVLI